MEQNRKKYTGRIVWMTFKIVVMKTILMKTVKCKSSHILTYTLLSGEGFFNITLGKTLIEGTPIVFLDNEEVPFNLLQNDTHYFIYVKYSHSAYFVTVGGTYTIPEFNMSLIPLSVIILASLLTIKRARSKKLC